MKTPHPIVATLQDIRDLLYRLAREWEYTVEQIEDPDAGEALTIALSDGCPLGRDIDELAAEVDTYIEHVERVLGNLPTVLQLAAGEISQDVQRITRDLAGERELTDDAYRSRQNGGEVGRFGGTFTPSIAAGLGELLLAVDVGDAEEIRQRADRLARNYRTAARNAIIAAARTATDNTGR